MAVRYVKFLCAPDARSWRYGHVTLSQKRKLMMLFGNKVRITRHRSMPEYDVFTVAGQTVRITPRGRVVKEE